MSTIATAKILILVPTDVNQASYKEAVCMSQTSEDVIGTAILRFLDENIWTDTLE